jgi:glutamate-1-semialdehyde 2,1-aminomutase
MLLDEAILELAEELIRAVPCAEQVFRTGARPRDGLAQAARRHGLAAQVSGEPPVFDILFTDRPVVDYRATLSADRGSIATFNRECLRRGVVKALNKIDVSLAHSDADVDETLDIFNEARAAVAALAPPERRTLPWT